MRLHLLPTALVLLLSLPVPSTALYSSERKRELRELTRATFNHAMGNYLRHAFPADELLPLSCKPQGHDRVHRENTAVNDVMGDYVLTLVDTLDTFVIMGDREAFEAGVRETIQRVSFDLDSRVQVFEVTIRMMGGLLSAHHLALPSPTNKRGFALPWYNSELLYLAHDLGVRLLPAFITPTGIPYARVHLQKGVSPKETTETCVAAATSLLLEFTLLSHLTDTPVFAEVAKKAFLATWERRSPLGLVGNTIEVAGGRWLHGYRGTNMYTGMLSSVIVDSLSAFFPGVQSLDGNLEDAIKGHMMYQFLWRRYGGLPEGFDIHRRVASHLGYPLRPELVESNMYLYLATKDEFYLSFAEDILHDIRNRTTVPCGLAAIFDLTNGQLEDKMPSFVTSETLKYLYLSFDEDNQFNKDDSNLVFSTEGHMLAMSPSPPPRNLDEEGNEVPGPICEAYDPLLNGRTQHELSTSVDRRTDFEYARWLCGYVIKDEAREIREGRWSESGYCDAPIAEQRVPLGKLVRIADPVVLATVPQHRLEKVHLNIIVDGAKVQLPGLASSFGPSIMHPPSSNAFAISRPPLPLLIPHVQSGAYYGCDPHELDASSVKGKVVVLRRGVCSFARKSNIAALEGAKAVIVINMANEEDIVPSAEGEERELAALVPMVLVSNSTGMALETMVESGVEALVEAEESKEEGPEPMVLGGYHVMNVRLQRP
ncbi:ER degradation enhancer, mannosidase alpha-like 1, glycoside hydrolase family 47 protein [Pseudohyphozyma bogoriensis]|nr:ER degradation enhancer, mannosidase alpha-like 1, glycoside hydrolase family 47 protein [Pseudohyphozyma bogoriensis]